MENLLIKAKVESFARSKNLLSQDNFVKYDGSFLGGDVYVRGLLTKPGQTPRATGSPLYFLVVNGVVSILDGDDYLAYIERTNEE